MTSETQVTVRYDSASLFEALQELFPDWRLADHAFDTTNDELRISHDVGGTGRASITVAFELDTDQMRRLLSRGRLPSGPAEDDDER